jgi:hypothetical protein
MWFFQWFQAGFYNTAVYIEGIRQLWQQYLGWIPYVGEWLYQIEQFFYNMATAAAAADTWSDTALQNLGEFIYYVNFVITAFKYQFAGQVQSVYNDFYYLLMWKRYVVEPWITMIEEKIRNLAEPVFQFTSDLASYVWSWITSGYLQTWLQNWLDPTWLWNRIAAYAHFDFVNEWISEVQDWMIAWVESVMGWMLTVAFDTLDTSWSSFTGAFAWLLDRLIALMWDQAVHFAPALWSLLEAVLKNIQVPER